MIYFSNVIAYLEKFFPQTKSTAVNAEEHLNLVESEAVGDYLKALKKENKSATICDLCEKFKIADDFEMATIIAKLEKSGKAIMNGFKPVYQGDGGKFYLAKYTGTD